MRHTVEIAATAAKEIAALPRKMQQRRVVSAVEKLADTPRPPGVRKLKGARDVWRIRIGDYRVIYRIRDAVLDVLVLRVGNRRDIYRRR